MIDEQIALARRAVACSGFRWMPGMRCLVGPLHAPYRYVTHDYAPPEGKDVAFTDPFLPDLQDPATLGCLLALVREAWWQDDMGASRYKDQWCVDVTPQEAPNYAFYAFYGASEAEALVAALEAAP